jgi:PPM family protein phosphatase
MPGTGFPLGGCAGTVVWLYEEKIHVFHAGDTIALLIRDGIFQQLTALHELGGAIYRYFGMGERLQIDIESHDIEESDRILIMSDGVTKAMVPQEIAVIAEKHPDKFKAVFEIANRSRAIGSQDDITVMMIEVEFEY